MDWFEPCLHSAYYQIVANLTRAQGMPAGRDVTGPARLLPLLDFLPLLDSLKARTATEIGMIMGAQISSAAHGPMGLAAMASATPWQAMQTIERFGPVRNRLFEINAKIEAGQAELRFRPRIQLGQYQRLLQGATLVAMVRVMRAILSEEEVRQLRVHLPWGPQAHAITPLPDLPASYILNADRLEISLPEALAHASLPTADATIYTLICRAGEQELSKLAGDTSARARHLLHCSQPDWMPLDVLAERLTMSRRTLIRKLEREGTSYHALLDDARFELACWYLRHSSLSLGQIAEKIGFSAQTNFSRGFTRWNGQNPRQYRQRFPRNSPTNTVLAGI